MSPPIYKQLEINTLLRGLIDMKFTLEQVMKAPEGEFWYSSILSLTSALDMVGGQRHAPAAVIPGKRPVTLCTGVRVGLRTD
jgi:hypothetical protein